MSAFHYREPYAQSRHRVLRQHLWPPRWKGCCAAVDWCDDLRPTRLRTVTPEVSRRGRSSSTGPVEPRATPGSLRRGGGFEQPRFGRRRIRPTPMHHFGNGRSRGTAPPESTSEPQNDSPDTLRALDSEVHHVISPTARCCNSPGSASSGIQCDPDLPTRI